MTMTEENVEPVPEPSSVGRAAVEELAEAALLDDLMARIDAGGLQLTGEGGFLPEMIKASSSEGCRPS